MQHYNTKLEKLILSANLTPSAAHLLRFIHSLARKINQEIEIDLKDGFNLYIKKHKGKSYCFRTLKRAIAELEEAGLIVIVQKYSWRWYKITISGGVKQNVQSKTEAEKKASRTTRKDFDSVRQQQRKFIPKEKFYKFCDLLIQNEFYFDFKSFLKLASVNTVKELEKSITLFRVRGGRDKISNPEGWLINCLSRKWWLSYDFYLGMKDNGNGFKFDESIRKSYVKNFWNEHFFKQIPADYFQNLIEA